MGNWLKTAWAWVKASRVYIGLALVLGAVAAFFVKLVQSLKRERDIARAEAEGLRRIDEQRDLLESSKEVIRQEHEEAEEVIQAKVEKAVAENKAAEEKIVESARTGSLAGAINKRIADKRNGEAK